MAEGVESHISALYDIKSRLGKGAYGIVWKAEQREEPHQTVAIKKIFDAFRNVTDAQRTFREIMYLQAFHSHENIISLQNVIKADNNRDIYLVFDHMDTDLHRAIEGRLLEDVHIQYILYQILRAIAYMHSAEIIHRDMKPSNVLLNEDCFAALCDFGLARSLRDLETSGELEDGQLTEYVATRWYRSPEILLSSSRYTKAIDMWSIGCIFGEMLGGKPMFTGSNSFNQVHLISQCIGKPNREDMTAMEAPYAEACFAKAPRSAGRSLAERLPRARASFEALDLLSKLLQFNPRKRLSAQKAMRHPYLKDFYDPSHELDYGRPVKLPLDDNARLTISDYRTHLYEQILRRRDEIQASTRVPDPVRIPESAYNGEGYVSARASDRTPRPGDYSARSTGKATPRNTITSARALSSARPKRDTSPVQDYSSRRAQPARNGRAAAKIEAKIDTADPWDRKSTVATAVSVAKQQQQQQIPQQGMNSRAQRAHQLRNTSSVFSGLSEDVDYSREQQGSKQGLRPSSAWRATPQGYGRTGPGDTGGGFLRSTKPARAPRAKSAGTRYNANPWTSAGSTLSRSGRR